MTKHTTLVDLVAANAPDYVEHLGENAETVLEFYASRPDRPLSNKLKGAELIKQRAIAIAMVRAHRGHGAEVEAPATIGGEPKKRRGRPAGSKNVVAEEVAEPTAPILSAAVTEIFQSLQQACPRATLTISADGKSVLVAHRGKLPADATNIMKLTKAVHGISFASKNTVIA